MLSNIEVHAISLQVEMDLSLRSHNFLQGLSAESAPLENMGVKVSLSYVQRDCDKENRRDIL